MDLLKYEDDANTADLFDKIYSTSLITQKTSPKIIATRSKTLIDNIFSTDGNSGALSGNLSGNIVTNISDNLTQFLSFENKFLIKRKKNINKTTKTLTSASL